MNKKIFAPFLAATMLITMPLLQSCNSDDYDPMNWDLSVGNLSLDESRGDCLILDTAEEEEDALLIMNSDEIPTAYYKDDLRVLASYEILDEKVDGFEASIRLIDIDSILVKDIIPLTPESADSIGNDPIEIKAAWLSSRYLTLQFEFVGNGQTQHMINVVRDYGINATPDSDGYINLEFRHNNNGDVLGNTGLGDSGYNMTGIASFRLGDIAPSPGYIKGVKVSAWSTSNKLEIHKLSLGSEDDEDDVLESIMNARIR